MHQLVYLSRASVHVDDLLLTDVRTVAGTNNRALGVTGALLYANGHFLQMLEGEQAPVRSLFESIRRDPRHTECVVLMEAESPSRLFCGWSMDVINLEGARRFSAAQFRALIAFFDLVKHRYSAGSRAAGLLKLFQSYVLDELNEQTGREAA